MPGIDDILAVAEDPAQRRSAVARILLRQDLERRRADLAARFGGPALEAGLNPSKEQTAAAAELRELEDEIEAAMVEFRFAAVGRRAWADLMAKHPPTKHQRTVNPRLDHNPDSFPIAAIAASCIDPVMTVEDVTRLDKALSVTQFGKLWEACLEANLGGDVGPKSAIAGLILRANERSVTTAVNGESHAPSSSDGS